MAEKSSTSSGSSGGVKPTNMSPQAWKMLDEKAMSFIELHLFDEVICNVMKDNRAKGTWKKLEKLYMGKSLSNKLTLKDQLYGLKMEKGGECHDTLE
ncbi:hypothetical protein JRO89_XS11G0133100 [Xanthoceras sorbifolium]|uniref:Retrovirus-related Pol polyprotein from transposon TNT 1-94 n=1 Tax=Xanthoceras sorbifolium TaxID=99658 RepID=A0ABQ8HFH1_9ROSI|nr:hypothetical protein JRO89_XS11G0133100 [Xanthoceras sorbifolium]